MGVGYPVGLLCQPFPELRYPSWIRGTPPGDDSFPRAEPDPRGNNIQLLSSRLHLSGSCHGKPHGSLWRPEGYHPFLCPPGGRNPAHGGSKRLRYSLSGLCSRWGRIFSHVDPDGHCSAEVVWLEEEGHGPWNTLHWVRSWLCGHGLVLSGPRPILFMAALLVFAGDLGPRHGPGQRGFSPQAGLRTSRRPHGVRGTPPLKDNTWTA